MSDVAADDFSWMDAAPAPVARKKKRRVKKSKRKAAKKVIVQAGAKIDHEKIRGRAMMSAVKGKKRIWACDGEYVYFRRKSCLGPDGQTDGSGNVHAAITRHNRFLGNGDYAHVETQDDVEICKVNPQSALYRKGQYLGRMSNGMVQRAIVVAACKRDWATYADALLEFAGRIKGKWQHATQAELAWNEVLQYLEIQVSMRGGPTPAECGAGLQNIRERRGEGSGRLIVLGS